MQHSKVVKMTISSEADATAGSINLYFTKVCTEEKVLKSNQTQLKEHSQNTLEKE